MKNNRKRSNMRPKIMIISIILAMIVIAAVIIYIKLSESTFFAERKFESLGRNYYENSIYDELLKGHDEANLKSVFGKYKKSGLIVKLRQLLNDALLKNGEDYRSLFETEHYSCDTNKSKVIYRPHEPYGKKDYDAEFVLDCSEL